MENPKWLLNPQIQQAPTSSAPSDASSLTATWAPESPKDRTSHSHVGSDDLGSNATGSPIVEYEQKGRKIASEDPAETGSTENAPTDLNWYDIMTHYSIIGILRSKALTEAPGTRLTSVSLPSYDRVLLLVEKYFQMIHPLRSFGFIHEPTFLQELEDQSSDERSQNMLLLIVCALGAKCVISLSRSRFLQHYGLIRQVLRSTTLCPIASYGWPCFEGW